RGNGNHDEESVCLHRPGRCWPVDEDRGGEGPPHPPRHQAWHLRRTRRRSRIGEVLPPHRIELCKLLALPRAGGPPGCGASRPRRAERFEAKEVIWISGGEATA